MGLETANYIPELVASNPVGAVDPKSEGDDHLRMLKVVLQSQFLNFESTTVSPKPVTLTEDQINDAALKSAANTFIGANTFTGVNRHSQKIVLDNNVYLQGKNTLDGDRDLIALTAANEVEVGNTSSVNTVINTGGNIKGFIGIQEIFRGVSQATGSLQIADSGGTLGNVAAVHKAQTFTENNQFNNFLRFPNSVGLSMQETGGARRNVMSVNSSDQLTVGTTLLPTYFDGTQLIARHAGTTIAETATIANGSLLIRDRGGVTKKAGFRNVTFVNVTTPGTRVITQDDEGRALNAGTAGVVFELPTLEAGTTLRIMTRADASQITSGTGLAELNWLDGSGSLTSGNRNVARNSIVEVYYRTATAAEIFGNGLS